MVANDSAKEAAEHVVAVLLAPDPPVEWLRPETTGRACAGLQRAAAAALLQVTNRFPKYLFALGKRQVVLRAVDDVAESLLDGVAYDGIADHAIPSVRVGLVQRTRQLAGGGQKRGDLRQAMLVTNLQLLMQVVAVTKGSVLGQERVEPVQGVRVVHVPSRARRHGVLRRRRRRRGDRRRTGPALPPRCIRLRGSVGTHRSSARSRARRGPPIPSRRSPTHRARRRPH